jgi:DNA repair protein RecO (recombination protein O)
MMPGMHTQPETIRGLVLRRSPLGEYDQIITVYTRQLGKIRVIARGSLRTRSVWRGKFEPFHQIEAGIFRSGKSSLYRFSHAEVIGRPKGFLGHLTALNTAYLLLECLDAYCEPESPNRDLYRESVAALARINRNADIAAYFMLCFCFRFFVLSGYGLNWSHCARCNRERAFNKSAYCIPAAGGILCSGCASGEQKRKEWIVPADLLQLAWSAAAGKPVRPDTLEKVTVNRFCVTSLRLVREMFSHHMDGIPKTLKMIETFVH